MQSGEGEGVPTVSDSVHQHVQHAKHGIKDLNACSYAKHLIMLVLELRYSEQQNCCNVFMFWIGH